MEEQDADLERRSTFLSICDKFQDIVQRCTIGTKGKLYIFKTRSAARMKTIPSNKYVFFILEPTMLTTAPPATGSFKPLNDRE